MNKFIKARAVVSCSGDYVAWHEMYISVGYILGNHGKQPWCFEEEIFDWKEASGYIYDRTAREWDRPLTSVDKASLDAYVETLVEADDGDYTDYEIQSVLLELNSDGNIVGTYLSC